MTSIQTRLLLVLCLSLGACTSMQNIGDDVLGTVDRIFAPPAEAKPDYDLAEAQCKRLPGGALVAEADYNNCMKGKGHTPRAGIRAPFLGDS